MLIEGLGVDPVGKALHDEGPIGDDGKEKRGNLDVVAEQIALGQLLPRPEHLGQVGDRYVFSARQVEDTVAAALLEGVELVEKGSDLRLI